MVAYNLNLFPKFLQNENIWCILLAPKFAFLERKKFQY